MSRSAILSACAATAVALLISAVAQGATCDVEGADALDVAAARDIAQTACGCPSTGPSRPWRRCVRNAIRELRDTGFLSIACERAARRLELRSTCARTDRVVCCRTNGVGETDAVVRAADKCVAPKHGTACTSPFAHVADACVSGGCATEGVCGNSVVEPGEACDPPNGWNCNRECKATVCPDGRPGLLVGCSPGSPAVEIEGIGETFLAAFNGSFDGIEFAQIRRFGSSGDLLDALPLPISRDPTDLPFAGHRVDAVTENGGHFVVATRNVITDQELRTRILPTTGPVVAPIELRWSLSPVGSTSDVIGSAAIAPNLAGDDVEAAVRHIRQSVGVIFFETLFGAPDGWFLQSGQSGDTSEGGAALARGSSDVAAAWWNVFMPTIGLSTMRTLRAGWYEPAPNTTFDLVAIGNVAKSRVPALAAAGDVFLAIWTQAPTSTGLDATELRGMRFKRSLGRLDAPGGLLLATGTGALSQPVVDSDGTEFVVAWAEATEDGTAAVRSLRVSTHGTVRPSVDVVRVSAGSPIDVAATSSAAFVGVAEVESTGNVGVRVIALP